MIQAQMSGVASTDPVSVGKLIRWQMSLLAVPKFGRGRAKIEADISNSGAIPTGSIVLAAIADDGGFIWYTPPESNCHVPWSDPRAVTGYMAFR